MLAILKSNQLSTNAYLLAYLQRYQQTIESNSHVRDLTMRGIRNQLSAILLNLESVKGLEADLLDSKKSQSASSNTTSKEIAQNIKTIAQFITCFDMTSKHQFLELDNKCFIDGNQGKQVQQLTPEVLNNECYYRIKTLPFFKKALTAYRDFVNLNRITTSIFQIEAIYQVPEKLLVNREALSALICTTLGIALASSRNKSISVYIQWKPRDPNSHHFQVAQRPNYSIKPVFEMKPLSEQSFSSLNHKIDTKLEKLQEGEAPLSDCAEKVASKTGSQRRPTGDWGDPNNEFYSPTQQESVEFTPILRNSELYPYSFRSLQTPFTQNEEVLPGEVSPIAKNSQSLFHEKTSFSTSLSAYLHKTKNQKEQPKIRSEEMKQKQEQFAEKAVVRKLESEELKIATRLNYSQTSLEKLLHRIELNDKRPDIRMSSTKIKNLKPGNLNQQLMGFKFGNRKSSSLKSLFPEYSASVSSVLLNQTLSSQDKTPKWYEGTHDLSLSRVSEISKEQFDNVSHRKESFPSIESDKSVKSEKRNGQGKLNVNKNVKELNRSLNDAIIIDKLSSSSVHPENSSQHSQHKQALSKSLDPSAQVQSRHNQSDQLDSDEDQHEVELDIPDEEVNIQINHLFLESDAKTGIKCQRSEAGRIQYVFDLPQSPYFAQAAPQVQNVESTEQQVPSLISRPISFNQIDERIRAVSLGGPRVRGNLGASGETQEEFSVSSEGYNVSPNISRANSIHYIEPQAPMEEVNQGEILQNENSSSSGQRPGQLSIITEESSFIGYTNNNQEEEKHHNNQSFNSQGLRNCNKRSPLNLSEQESIIQQADSQVARAPMGKFEQNPIKNIKMMSSTEETQGLNEPLLKQPNKEVKFVRNKSFSFKGSSSPLEQEGLLDVITINQDAQISANEPSNAKQVYLNKWPRLPAKSEMSFGRQISSSQVFEQHKLIAQVISQIQSNMKSTYKQNISSIDTEKEPLAQNKVVEVRTLRRGRSKSIVVPGVKDPISKVKICRLNNYTPSLKKHKGSISLSSDLGSIEEESEPRPSGGGNSNQQYKQNSSNGQKEEKERKALQNEKQNGSFANYKFGVIVESAGSNSILNSSRPQGSIYQTTEESKDESEINQRKYSRSSTFTQKEYVQSETSNPTIVIKNYGHGKRSNLKKKASQIIQKRSKSVVVDHKIIEDINTKAQPIQLVTLDKQQTDHNDVLITPKSKQSSMSFQASQEQQNSAELSRSPKVQKEDLPKRIDDEGILKSSAAIIPLSTANNKTTLGMGQSLSSISKGSDVNLKHFDFGIKYSPQQSSPEIKSQLRSPSKEIIESFKRYQLDTQNLSESTQKVSTYLSSDEQKNKHQDNSQAKETQNLGPKMLRNLSNSGNKSKKRFESSFTSLKSTIGSNHTSKETKEIMEIIAAWGKKSFLPQPDTATPVTDGILQIQIYDVKTCRRQIIPSKTQNIADIVSSGSLCSELSCNRSLATKLMNEQIIEQQKWTSILNLTNMTPEIELSKLLAELIGGEVLVQHKNQNQGFQFCISVPTISMPGSIKDD